MSKNILATFFVATHGNDNWSGQLPEANPCRTDGPFATLRRARDAVRALKVAQEDRKELLTVMVRGGKYYPESTLDLTAADSGTEEAPVIYCAYPGETPVISGGRRVTDWRPHKDKIVKCAVPEAKGGALSFRHLYADGKRQIRARYPNLDPNATGWNGKWAHSKADTAALESSEAYIVWDEPEAFQRFWSKPAQGEIFMLPRQSMWGDSSLIRIKSVDREKKIIRLVHGMRSYDFNPLFLHRTLHRPDDCQFIVENILEELDQPGEWCLDTEDGMLYFWSPNNAVEQMNVVIPVVKRLLHMEGVSNVHISGFVFTETNGGEPSSHYADVDGLGAMSPQMGWEYSGETIYMTRCTNCRIENSRITHVGGNGIYLRNQNERNVIRGNEISYAGANGVVLAGGRLSLYRGYGGVIGIPHPIFNEVTDNSIHHIGLVDTYVAGVFLGLGNWNRVAHNEIHDVPHHAINLGNSRYGRNYIEYNRIARSATVSNDNAAINCWHEMPTEMEPPGHVIRYNFISETGNTALSGLGFIFTLGIYLDNWTSNCLVYGNIVVDTLPKGRGIGILIKGRNNIVENNIVVNAGSSHIFVCPHCCCAEFATVVSRNILYDTLGTDSPFLELPEETPLYKALLQCDGNLFYRKGDENPLITKDVRFSDWPKKYGRDEEVPSLVADPLFMDAAGGDYGLRTESPALKMGFQPIDISRIGIRRK